MAIDDPIVLRYRDVTNSTIAEHRAILDTQPYVWWGWWRKEGIEPDRLDVLARVARSPRRIRVGLVNREAPAFHRAYCTQVVFDPEGGRIHCPEPDLAPEYYRTEACAAWFRLTDIVPLDKRAYRAEFGPVPAGNSTLYEVRRRGAVLEVLPKPDWNLVPTTTNGNAILHLSDLHFGSFHGYPVGVSPPGRDLRESPLDQILLEHLSDEDIGVVVISGDCISRGEVSAFRDLENFLERLADGLDLEAKNFVIVPGNHDFELLPADGPNPTIDYGYERDFRRFMENFYERPDLELERLQRFRTAAGWDLVFVALNSARLRSVSAKEYGYVGRDQYAGMLSYAAKALSGQAPKDRRVLMSVLHHHVEPVPQTELLPPAGKISLTVDAAELLTEFQRNGVQLVLHGHQHLPFVASPRRAVHHGHRLVLPPAADSLFVVGMGSTGAMVSALADELRENTYGVYEPTPDGLRVRIHTFNRARGPQVYFDDVLTLRA